MHYEPLAAPIATAMTTDVLLQRPAARPLPAPPRRNRLLAWALFVMIWGLSTGLLVAGAQAAAALAN